MKKDNLKDNERIEEADNEKDGSKNIVPQEQTKNKNTMKEEDQKEKNNYENKENKKHGKIPEEVENKTKDEDKSLSDIKSDGTIKYFLDTMKKYNRGNGNKYHSASVSDEFLKELNSADDIKLNNSQKKEYSFLGKELNRYSSYDSFRSNKKKTSMQSYMSHLSYSK